MAKITRLLFGGMIGAGLAYLLSRKDVRRRLMGGGQAQLPAASEPQSEAAATGSRNLGVPVEAPAAPVDLEARIGETRSQLEEHLEATIAPAAGVETASTAPETSETGNEIDLAEAPEVLLEEEVVGEPATGIETQAEPEAPLSSEAEAIEETAPSVESGGADYVAPEEEALAEATEVTSPDIEEIIAGETGPAEEPPAPAQIEEKGETDEFAALKTPLEGEPTFEAPAETAEESLAAPDAPVPSQIDREEMRRRIDETRNRLKAKAFDAMVSGETFIEPEVEGASQVRKTEPDTALEKDLEEHIDKSLTEQD